jgi:hypothetical protein
VEEIQPSSAFSGLAVLKNSSQLSLLTAAAVALLPVKARATLLIMPRAGDAAGADVGLATAGAEGRAA